MENILFIFNKQIVYKKKNTLHVVRINLPACNNLINIYGMQDATCNYIHLSIVLYPFKVRHAVGFIL